MNGIESLLFVARWIYKAKYSRVKRQESDSAIFRDKTIAVLSPHPDDEIIGIGGSILKLKKIYPDLKVYFIYLTNGELGNDSLPPSLVSRIRKEEAAGVCKEINVTSIFLDFQERHFIDQRKESSDKLQQVLSEIKPDFVAVPSVLDYHLDHINTNLLLYDCKNYLQSVKPFEILMYPVRIPFVETRYANFIIDVSEQMREKERLLLEGYASQAKIINMQRFLINNKVQGVTLGKKSVEIFWRCSTEQFSKLIQFVFHECRDEKTYKWSLLPKYSDFKFSPVQPMRRYSLSMKSQKLLP